MTTKHDLHRAIDQLSEAQLQKIIRVVEALQADASSMHRTVDLKRYSGILRLSEDPLAFQETLRKEWR